ADAQPARAGGHVRGHDVDRGTDAVRVEVMLGEPDAIVARPLHDLDPIHGSGVDLGERRPPRPREELEDADVHRRRCFAMISRITSEVPDAIVHRRTSRKKRSTGNSAMYPYPPCSCTAWYATRFAASVANSLAIETSRAHSSPSA